MTQVQDSTPGLIEHHAVVLGPLIECAKVPLQSLSTLKQINTPIQLGIFYKFTEDT